MMMMGLLVSCGMTWDLAKEARGYLGENEVGLNGFSGLGDVFRKVKSLEGFTVAIEIHWIYIMTSWFMRFSLKLEHWLSVDAVATSHPQDS